MSDTARDFLVELGTEELPPLALPELEKAFAAGIRAGLDRSRRCRTANCVRSRRRAGSRCWCAISRVMQPAQAIKLKGPPVSAAFDKDGKPTAAATKFAEKCGADVDALTRVTEGKGEFLYFAGSKPGLATASLLPASCSARSMQLPIPKRMRWGASSAEFVRPGALAGDAVRRGRHSRAHPRHRRGTRDARPSLHGAAGVRARAARGLRSTRCAKRAR